MNSESSSSNTSINDVLQTYLKHWKWFVFSAIIALGLAMVYLRYTTPQFSAQSKILILDEKGGGSELSMLKELDLFSSAGSNVEDEVQTLNSRSNFIKVVKDLKLNVRMIILGNIKDTEIYQEPRPFKINFLAADSVLYKSNFSFFISSTSSTTFGFNEKDDDPVKVYAYGKNINTPAGEIIITPTNVDFSFYEGKRFQIVIAPLGEVAQSYQTEMNLNIVDKLSNIVEINLTDPIQQKAIDIIDALVNTYNQNGVIDKKAVADRTSNFIDDRIIEISVSLSSVDQNAVDFMTNKGLSDIGSQTNINLSTSAANQQELENARYQLMVAQAMKEEVSSQSDFQQLPTNIGLSDPTISSATAKFNEVAAERKRLLESSSEKNPIIVSLDQQLNSLKSTIESSLGGMSENLSLKLNSLSGQQSRLNSSLYSAPKNSQALRDITRQQQTTESLYLYLLQKREEAQISYASASAKSKVIDSAYASSPFPVSPKPNVVMLAALIFGLLVPFSVIYTKDLLDNKIKNKTTLERLAKDIPVLAELPKINRRQKKILVDDDRSVLAESLRILRTNLDYLISGSKGTNHKNNVIYITSSVPGEGKTFLSSNLAMVLANTNKKVLLIGADIRNPKIHSFFDENKSDIDKLNSANQKNNHQFGLTEFLYNKELSSNDIINALFVHKNEVDVIYSGKVPPNPAELLMSKRFETLIRDMSALYDYVIVDTAPLMVVSDTLIITKYSDHVIYVTRAGVTETNVIDFPIKLKNEGKLKNLSFVVNDVKENNLGYGGKYGYGYGATAKKWWKF
jgi:capsular exopolysaccharide synthesis family protein